MAYEIEIPDKLKPTIEKYISNSYKGMSWNATELDFLLTVFYRYVQQLGSYKSVEDKVKRKRNCGGCRKTMRDYFNKAIDNWSNSETWQ